MKNFKRIFQTSLLAITLLIAGKGAHAQTISPIYFGENAWMPDTIGNASDCQEPPCILYGKLHKNWDKIQDSKASVIRYGGIAADRNMPTKFQYIRMIDSIRAHGMEPIIQVPFHNWRYSAAQAAEIVNYINVVKGKNIKYWIIANEPDLGYGFTTDNQIANYFRPFSSAMKAVDPSIKIIGPEIASYNSSIISGLTNPGGPDDITGKDAAGRYYIDIITFHTYPFNGSQTRAQVITKLTGANQFEQNLIHLNGKVSAANTHHGRTGANKLKTAVTEANINWKNSASDNVNGVGANSFIGGQFVAEMLGLGLKHNVETINIWSVIEGNTTELNIGFIDPTTGNKKSTYHHFKMMAENFKGNYVTSTSNNANVKIFSSKDANQISVMIMNQDLNSFNYTVKLATGTVTGASPVKMNVDADVSYEHTETIQGESTVMLVFNTSGVLLKKYEYSLTGHAVANQAPTVTDYIATGVETATTPEDGGDFEMKVFPNPSSGKFTVELKKGNSEEKSFQVELYNMLGQQVISKKSTFYNGKEMLELSEGMAQGAYILQVKDGDHKVATKRIILSK
ncbi:MAG: T9SS type A sorting domain-containing protein [Bacteroidota bacterium]|nr:T9SS type A sorting domain-containing protein [Bacteroidota bacterium]